MSNKTIYGRVAPLAYTTTEWAALEAAGNVVLKCGEVGYDKTVKKYKVGDGATIWSNLDFEPTPTEVSNIINGTTAVGKLGTDAGSATQPVYFNNGIPVVTTYSLGQNVPATTTWTIGNDVIPTGTSGATHGLMTADQAKKLAEISAGAEVNQNTYSAVTAYLTPSASSGTTLTATSKTDTLSIKAGANVTLSTGTKEITINSSDTVTTIASTTGNGNAITAITASGGQLTLTKGTTFLTEHQSLANYAPLSSPEFSGTPKAPTATAGTNTTQIATTAFVKAAVDAATTAAGAMVYKGTLGTGGTISSLPNNHTKGDTYKVITAATYAGKVCEVGDMIICLNTGTTASNSDWTVVQGNIDGAVIGPASAVVNNITLFNNANGKEIKDSGIAIGTGANNVPQIGTALSGTGYPVLVDANGKLKPGTGVLGSAAYANSSSFLSSSTAYAGAGTAGGAASSALKLSNTSVIGGTTQPVYFTANGVPAAISYTIGASVPSTAVFTDENVKMTASSSNGAYPVLLKYTTGTSTTTEGARFDADVSVNPSTGALSATSFNATSSRERKENITETTLNACSLINNIKIVNFNYINDETKAPHIGFIAEDTDPILSTPSMDHMDMVNTLGVLLKAVQELSAKNRELENKIISLIK